MASSVSDSMAYGNETRKGQFGTNEGKRISASSRAAKRRERSSFNSWMPGSGTVNDTMMTNKNAAPKKKSNFLERLGDSFYDIPSIDAG